MIENEKKDNNKFKTLLKTAIEVIVLVILIFIIKDNFYVIKNKAEYIYIKYLQSDIRQNLVDNEYKKGINYEYLKINTNTNIKNKEDARNAIYTFLDAGWEEYMVKCDPDYLTCINDVKEITQSNNTLSDISNFVHPFNSFKGLETSFSRTGKIRFRKVNKYTEKQINEINKKVNEIYNENYDSKKNIRDNIKIFHDYIINNTTYDIENKNNKKDSSGAYGVLFEGKGICSGYTDAMSLFLEKLNVKNYRIENDTHTWNLVYVEGKWLNLDLTWDDPITNDGTNKLRYDYFLIDTNTLLEKNDGEHNFDDSIYMEAK